MTIDTSPQSRTRGADEGDGTVTDRPIIFSAPMVRALLEGRKTMTRRLTTSPLAKSVPGARLWVRETFAIVGTCDPGYPIYAANWREDCHARGFDNIPAEPPKWKPSMFMWRWASRLTLIVTGTKIERLQDISAADSIAEGVQCATCEAMNKSACLRLGCFASKGAFAELWCRIHGREAWDANPEVVAIRFRVVKANIDAVKEMGI